MGETADVLYRFGGQWAKLDLARIQREVLKFDRSGWTRELLAAHLGISTRTLQRFVSGRRVRAASLHKILAGFYMEAADVLTYLEAQ